MAFHDLKVSHSNLFPELLIFEPSVSKDLRGTIFTTFQKDLYEKYLPKNLEFIHDKFAESKHNVLRGLHGDRKTWKLVTCIKGEIFQVVVDNRPDSPTFLKYQSWALNDKNKLQLLIPPNFVNGYYVLSDEAVFHYKLAYEGEYFDVKDQAVIRWNDPRLGINWPTKDPILQDRDK